MGTDGGVVFAIELGRKWSRVSVVRDGGFEGIRGEGGRWEIPYFVGEKGNEESIYDLL